MPDRNNIDTRSLPATTLRRLVVVTTLLLSASRALAQPKALTQAPVPIVMLSDLHFDPLRDPAKVPLLIKAPVTQWDSILATPDSSEQPSRFAAMQKTCNAKDATDTPYALLTSSLAAAKAQSLNAGFITVSGDLLVHDLDCRYRVALNLPSSTKDDQSLSAAFAEKTTIFVMNKVNSTFPNIPVYIALGNNDSLCNHNRMDSHDAYLRTTGPAMLAGLRGVNTAEKVAAQRTYESAGYYAVTMPAPMRNTRLIVVDDIYMMPKYTNCAAAEDDKGEQEQAAWLQKELEHAHSNKQRVWLLGHLPPTVNADASLSPKASFCANGQTVRFQTKDDLASQIMVNADTIKLGIFGHTHMDELHVLRGLSASVPVKVIASVSPVDGNLPSFTVGIVDTASATLTDYSVFKASNATGVETLWTQEYTFSGAYNEPGFSSRSLTDLIGRLHADKKGTGSESVAYKDHFLKGAAPKKLSPSWPGYVCSLDSSTEQQFKSCVCAAQ
jgi:sphingomyelin phosphodiesterase acid-like 3